MTTPQTKRVHQLARELGLSPQALLSLLATLPRPIQAETIMAHLSLEDVAYIREQVIHHGAAPEAKIDRFGELRGLLARSPSPELWASLLHEVSLNPEPQALQYVQDRLRSWPTHIPRPAPAELLASLPQSPHPALRLCDTLTLRGLRLNNDQLIALIDGQWFGPIRALDISHLGLSSRSIIALANSPHSRALRTLNLSYNSLNAAAFLALGQSPHLSALEHLILEGTGLTVQDRQTLYESPLGQRLVTINTGFLAADFDACARQLEVSAWAMPSTPCASLDDDALSTLKAQALLKPQQWGTWSHGEQQRSAQALRDLYFIARQDDASEALRQQVRKTCELMPALDPFEVLSLKVSWHPSQRHKQLRFLPADSVPPGQRALCHKTRCLEQDFIAVFADPLELNYQCFENILPLATLFEQEGAALAPGALTRLYLSSELEAYTLKVNPTPSALAALDALACSELYLSPSAGSSRGGQRFIFHSAGLADALTSMVSSALPASCLAPGDERFVHVNPAFRFNRFRPDDEPFYAHLDTPYYDAGRAHISRYTLLLYLSGGSADAALSLDDLAITELAPMTCVIFDQRIEHEGRPYEEGDKLFLRTELIFTARQLEHKPDIAQLFSKACYLNSHCAVFPELATLMSQRYEQAARAHWGQVTAPSAAAEPYLQKRYKGVEFFTNGYDLWCSSAQLSLKEAAALAILDHLNCRVGEDAFYSLCDVEVVYPDAQAPSAWLLGRLAALEAPTQPLFWTLNKANLCPSPQRSSDDDCCPFHHPHLNLNANADVLSALARAQDKVSAYLEGASIYMFGERIYLDPERLVVTPDKVFALSHKAPTPINFAACWNTGGSPDDYIKVAATARLPFLLVPPLLYQQHEGCYHLRLDFFKNDWMLDRRQLELPLAQLDIMGERQWAQAWEAQREALVRAR